MALVSCAAGRGARATDRVQPTLRQTPATTVGGAVRVRSAGGQRLLAQLAGAGQDLVLDLANRQRAHRRIHPLPVVLQPLAENRDANAITAQLPPQYIG